MLLMVNLQLFAATTLDIVTYGDANGSDELDDRASIQKTIDAANGGTVTFPAGTFMLSKTGSGVWDTCCLIVYENITLQGAGRTLTTLKLK